MPVQTTKSTLAAALGPQAQAAAKEAAKGEVQWGPDFSRLPPGIRGGIAQLTSCRFEQIDKDYPDAGIKKGDWQYRARAVMGARLQPLKRRSKPTCCRLSAQLRPRQKR